MMKTFLLAIQFLTILPVRLHSELKEEDFKSIFIFFPIVGGCIGALLAGLSLLLGAIPHLAAAAVILSAYTILTGALHLDGLADSCDGIFGGKTKERRLEIMQDSHLGAFAAVAVSTVLVLKFAFLASVDPSQLWKVLILTPVFSRWAQGVACCGIKYARGDGKANFFFKSVNPKDVLIGGILSLMIFVFLLGIKGLILYFSALIPICLLIKFIEKQIGGMTGDTIGAVNEIAEISLIFIYLIIA